MHLEIKRIFLKLVVKSTLSFGHHCRGTNSDFLISFSFYSFFIYLIFCSPIPYQSNSFISFLYSQQFDFAKRLTVPIMHVLLLLCELIYVIHTQCSLVLALAG